MTALVVDQGSFLHVAVKLSESYGRVQYFCPWTEGGFPSSKRRQIGCGVEGVDRVYDLWDAVPDADIIVVTDVYSHDLVHYLRDAGKPVWGAGKAEALEVERYATKRLMRSLGMNVIPYEHVEGVDALWSYVSDKTDMWIKGSATRGDMETLHWVNQHVSSPRLEKLLRDIGPRRHSMEFIVEPSIPGVEFGYDGYCIDGRFGSVALYGPEAKNAGYVGRVVPFDDLPRPLRIPTLELAPIQGKLGCRGFYSNEVRIATEDNEEFEISAGTEFLIDPAMRCGSPPSESYIELFSNWDEVIWAGANGEVVDLEPVAKFAAQIVLKSEWIAKMEYLPVYYPNSIKRWVKLHSYAVLDGQPTVMPQDYQEFGSVVGLGDTQDEAERRCISYAEKIEALDFDWNQNVFDEIREIIDKGRAVGIDWETE